MQTTIRTAIVLMAAALLAISPYSVLAEDASPPAQHYVWEDGKLSVQVKDVDIKEVVAGISKASGIETKIYEDVQGKIIYQGEKEPVEKAIDQVLRSVGQKNYVMAQEGGEARKIWILPKGKEIKDADAKGRMKVKGKLRNGKEIEYYPGEIFVGAREYVQSKGLLNDLINDLFTEYGLTLLNKSKYGKNLSLKFRITNDQDPLSVMRELLNDKRYRTQITFVTPNGYGPSSVEIPEVDFHVIKESDKQFESFSLKENPFIKEGAIYDSSNGIFKFIEEEFLVFVDGKDNLTLSYENIMCIAQSEGGVIAGYFKDPNGWSSTKMYILYFPGINDAHKYKQKFTDLRNLIHTKRISENSIVERSAVISAN